MKKLGIVVLALLLVAGMVVTPSMWETDFVQAAPAPEVLLELSTKGLEKVAESAGLELWANSASGAVAMYNKKTDTFWYSNPPEYMGEKMVGQERVLSSSQLKITFMDKQFIQGEALSTVGSLNKGGMTCQKLNDGVQFTYHFPQQKITVALCYKLKADYMEVSVPIDQIKEEGDHKLGEVSVLPFFGSGAAKDEGYIFVPDGSGALINFQNISHSNTAYSQPIYGRDRILTTVRKTYESETVRMPVLGIHRDKGGLLCVADKGAGLGKVNAQLSNMKEKRNMGYFSFQFRPTDWITLNSADRNARDVAAYAKVPAETDAFAVRYYPLEGEGTYFDMAQRYRKYLVDEKGLTKMKKKAEDLPFYVTSYAAVEKLGSVMWIPTDVVVPLTTADQMRTMLGELSESGIKGIVADYRGWQPGGYNGKLPTKGKIEKKVGSAKEFANLFAKPKDDKMPQVFTGLNLVDYFKTGNGFSKSNSVARTVTGAPALQYRYSYISGFRNEKQTPWYLLSPLKYGDVLDRLFKKHPADIYGVGLGAAGSELYSDMRKGGHDRIGMESFYVDAFKKAGEHGNVMADSVNAFLLPYVDYIAEAPVENSRFDIESARVPFYQLVLDGYKSCSVPAINLSGDAHRSFLYAAETLSSQHYVFNYQNFDEVADTCLESIYNSNYRDWKKEAAEEYKQLNDLYHQTAGSQVVNHTKPNANVAVVEYGNGTVVVVNYAHTAYTSKFGEVEPGSFRVFTGKGDKA